MKRAIVIIAAGLAIVLAAFAADELTVSDGFSYNKNGRYRSQSTASKEYDVTGNGVIENVQLVSTNAAGDALVMGGVATAGFAKFKNLGPSVGINTNESPATNSIEIGIYDVNTNFLAFITLGSNESAQVWLSSISLRARATGTNSVKLDYVIVDK